MDPKIQKRLEKLNFNKLRQASKASFGLTAGSRKDLMDKLSAVSKARLEKLADEVEGKKPTAATTGTGKSAASKPTDAEKTTEAEKTPPGQPPATGIEFNLRNIAIGAFVLLVLVAVYFLGKGNSASAAGNEGTVEFALSECPVDKSGKNLFSVNDTASLRDEACRYTANVEIPGDRRDNVYTYDGIVDSLTYAGHLPVEGPEATQVPEITQEPEATPNPDATPPALADQGAAFKELHCNRQDNFINNLKVQGRVPSWTLGDGNIGGSTSDPVSIVSSASGSEEVVVNAPESPGAITFFYNMTGSPLTQRAEGLPWNEVNQQHTITGCEWNGDLDDARRLVTEWQVGDTKAHVALFVVTLDAKGQLVLKDETPDIPGYAYTSPEVGLASEVTLVSAQGTSSDDEQEESSLGCDVDYAFNMENSMQYPSWEVAPNTGFVLDGDPGTYEIVGEKSGLTYEVDSTGIGGFTSGAFNGTDEGWIVTMTSTSWNTDKNPNGWNVYVCGFSGTAEELANRTLERQVSLDKPGYVFHSVIANADGYVFTDMTIAAYPGEKPLKVTSK